VPTAVMMAWGCSQQHGGGGTTSQASELPLMPSECLPKQPCQRPGIDHTTAEHTLWLSDKVEGGHALILLINAS
jgi:hypothetical protein